MGAWSSWNLSVTTPPQIGPMASPSRKDFPISKKPWTRCWNRPNYLEAPDAEEAIAAVEVLAKFLGKGTQSDTYTEEVDAWVAALKQKPDAVLLKKAQRVLQRVLAKDSELLDLWAEAEEAEAWKASIAALDAAIR